MSTLPKTYVQAVNGLTGYFGTYLPSRALGPGTLGRPVAGEFVTEGHIEKLPGFKASRHGTERQPFGSPVSVWRSKNVEMVTLGADASMPGAAAGRLQLKFSDADEAAILCNKLRYWSFVNLGEVKALLRHLHAAGQWDPELCLITEVLIVDWAWICFATASDQVAEIKLSAPTLATGDGAADDVLKAVAASGSIDASWQAKKSAGFYTEVGAGGTPLFRAIRFARGWPFGLGAEKLDYVTGALKGGGGPADFEDPDFSVNGPAGSG